MDIEKIKFINEYNPKRGGTFEKRRLYEKIVDMEISDLFNRGGLSINEGRLTEALIATYDIFKVKEIFERKYPEIEFRVAEQEKTEHINYCAMIVIPPKIFTKTLKSEIVDFMKFCGYAKQPDCLYKDNGILGMVFKPMFQSDNCTEEVRKKCKYIYHLTNKNNLSDIEKRGLIPSSKNTYFNYPDRIYFVLGNNLNNRTLNILKAVRKAHGGEPSVVLMFDLNKIPDNVNFHTDFDADESIFTHDNIPPSAITGMMDWSEIAGEEDK